MDQPSTHDVHQWVMAPSSHRSGRAAFTLIEMLVVIAVIAILAALSIAGAIAVLGQSNEDNTRTMLSTMALKMSSQGVLPLRMNDGTNRRRWDVNNDNILDGRIDPIIAVSDSHVPTYSDPGVETAITPSNQQIYYDLGYQGAFHALAMTMDVEKSVNIENGRLRDVFGNEIMIVFGKQYGSKGFGLISPGPDFRTDPALTTDGTYDPSLPECKDDIVSWGNN